jgi:aromatic-L-amino-acid decarboxylase
VERVNHSGAAYLTPALLDGRWMARVSIGSIQTERQHVEQVWEAMKQEAGRVADLHRIGHNH